MPDDGNGEQGTFPRDDSGFSRRSFLGKATLFAAGLAAPGFLAACSSSKKAVSAASSPTGAASSAAGATAATASSAASAATGAASSAASGGSAASSAGGLVVKAMKSGPKKAFEFRGQIFVTGNIWSDALEAGWKQAATDFGINIVAGGPATVDSAAQVAQLESWIIQKVDCIMVTAADPAALTPSINKAVAAGIPVITFDSDAPGSNRNVFDTGADSQQLAFAQIDSLARQMNKQGQWAFIIGELTQTEKQYQLQQMLARATAMYPGMKYLGVQECKDDQQTAANQAQALIERYPNLGGIISNSGSGCAGAAQGIEAAGKGKVVKVTGITFPTSGRKYVHDGTMPEFFIWNIQHQSYFAAALGVSLLTGQDVTNGLSLARFTGQSAPTMLEPAPSDPTKAVAILGPPLKIDSTNVDTLGP